MGKQDVDKKNKDVWAKRPFEGSRGLQQRLSLSVGQRRGKESPIDRSVYAE